MAEIILDLSTGYTAGTPTGRIGTGSVTAGGGNTGWGTILLSSSDSSRILGVNSSKDRIKIFYNSAPANSANWTLETIITTLSPSTNVVDVKFSDDGSRIYILYGNSSGQTTPAFCEIFTRSGTTWTLSSTISSPLIPGTLNYENFIIIKVDDANNRVFIGNDNGPAWEGADPLSSTSKIYVYNTSNPASPSLSQTLYTTAEYSWSLISLTTPWNTVNGNIASYPYMANKNYASVGIKDIVLTPNKINVYFNGGQEPWQFNYNGTWWKAQVLDNIGCPAGPAYLGGTCLIELPGEDGSLKFNSKNGILNLKATTNTNARIYYSYQSLGNNNYKMSNFEYSGDDINGSSSVFLDLSILVNFYKNKILSKIIFGNTDGSIVIISYKESDEIFFYRRKSKNSPSYYSTEDYRWELIGILSPNSTGTNWSFGEDIFITNGDILNNENGATLYGTTKLIVSAKNNGNGKAFIYDSPFYKPYINSSLKLVTKVGDSINYTITAIKDTDKNQQSPTQINLNSVDINTSELPNGLSYNSSTFTISGSPTVTGIFTINILARRNGFIDNKPLIIYCIGIANVNTDIYGKIKTKFLDYKFIGQGFIDSWELTGTLPAGLLFDSDAGVLYGTPQVSNSFPITVKAKKLNPSNNTLIEASKDFTIKIAPEILSDLDITIVHNEPMENYIVSVFSTNINSAPCSFSALGLPQGLNINSTNGTINGTPTESGTFYVNIRAENSGGFDIKVLKINILKITSSLSAFGKIGEIFSYKIIGDGQPEQFLAENLPENFYLFGDTIIGNPFFSNEYLIPIKIKKENKVYQSVLNIKIAPFITDGGITDKEINVYIPFNSPLSYKIPIFNPATNYTYSIISTENQSLSFYNLSLNQVNGVISGTPNFIGKKSFSVEISNVGGSYGKILNIYVLKIISPTSAISIYNKPFTYQILAEGDADYFTAENLPENFYLFGDTILGISTLENLTYTINLKAYKNGVYTSSNLVIENIPGMISDSEVSGNVGLPFNYAIIISSPSLNITILNKPSWLNYDSNTKILSGTPLDPGEYEVSFYINNYQTYINKIKIIIFAEKTSYIYKDKYNFHNRVNALGSSRIYKQDSVQKNLLESVNKLNELYKKIRC